MTVLFAWLVSVAMLAQAAPPQVLCPEVRRLQLAYPLGLLIVDVRDPNAFAQSHIQGAKNVPAKTIESAGLPRDARIVIYCGEPDCPLSANAADQLIRDGYTRISLLDGGLAEWIHQGYPLQKGPAVSWTPQRPRALLDDARKKVTDSQETPLDVRPALEFAAGHLPGAENIPLEQLDAQIVALPKNQQFIVYDRDPARARKALDKLLAAGLNASELSGGYAGWVRRNGKVEVK